MSAPEWILYAKHIPVIFQHISHITSINHEVFCNVLHQLHLPLDKMAAIFTDDTFKCIFMNEKFSISSYILLKLVPKGPIDNKSELVQVMYVEIRQSVEHSACVTGCYRTANDTWNSNVHKRCHASPWRRICCVMTSTEWRHKRGVLEVGLGCQGKLTQFGGENG